MLFICFQGNEIWRSVLLHHRAQLVKQLAEMDKLVSVLWQFDIEVGQCGFFRWLQYLIHL